MATNTMTDTFRAYLESCSDDMVNEIVGTLQQAGRRSVHSTASSMPVVESPAAKVEKKQRKKAKARRPASGAPKRPLNSWMAFRKFYNAMLAPHTQKVTSKVLTRFWQADPFEAKWAILAKAYSTVRGCREKSEAPLDEFLVHCAPLIGIIPPEEYLQCMGWQLGPPQDGDQEKMPQISRPFTPDFSTFPEEVMTTTLSVDDLVRHCYAVGYANVSNDDSPDAGTQGSLTMVSKPTAITTDDMNEATHGAPLGPFGYLVDLPPSPTNNADPTPFEVDPPAGLVTLDQAVRELAESGFEWPYHEAADPSIDLFGAGYDPTDPNTAVEDGGRWDAWHPNGLPAEVGEVPGSEEAAAFSWADFLNDHVAF